MLFDGFVSSGGLPASSWALVGMCLEVISSEKSPFLRGLDRFVTALGCFEELRAA